ncbi:general substrate transporter [Mycena rebaudengoi]|nr:general substrate transporter [Mycena rebaudengoi]
MHAADEKNELEHVPENAKIVEVENADLALALSTGPQLRPLSARSIQLYLILLVAFMGSLANGFDGSVMSAVNGMDTVNTWVISESQYERRISGTDSGGGVGSTTAIIFGIYSIGSIVAVPIAGPVTDRVGRRGGMVTNFDLAGRQSDTNFCGAIVATTSRSLGALLGGRFVLGLGVGIVQTASPSYVVEMAPPQWRGRLTGLFNSKALSPTTSWRAPLAIQIVAAGILAIFSLILPESPRWLLSVGQKDEALHILARYHGNDDVNSPLVLLEWKEFEESIKLNASDKRWWDYSELVNTRNARYRTFMMLLMAFFGQEADLGKIELQLLRFSLSSSASYFLTILFRNAGVNSQNGRLILNFVNTVVSACGALIGTALTDKEMWFWGTLSSAGTLAVVTGCTAKWGSEGSNPAGANAAIAFIFLHIHRSNQQLFTMCGQALYPAECLDYNSRAKGMAMYALAVACASFVNTYAGPIALQNIGWKFSVEAYGQCRLGVYVAWGLFECVVIYLFVVETRGRTLEELNEIFEDPNPVKASIRKRKVALAGDKVIPVNEPGHSV